MISSAAVVLQPLNLGAQSGSSLGWLQALTWRLFSVILSVLSQNSECPGREGPPHPGADSCRAEEVWIP